MKIWASLLLLIIVPTACAKPPVYSTPPDFTQNPLAQPQTVVELLYQQYAQWRGVPYRKGGLSRRGVDCSGLVFLTYRDKFGIALPRTTRLQARSGQRVSQKRLAAGDLLFFRTGFSGQHVGIYIEERQFLHVSASTGVTLSSINDRYWRRRYMKAVRIGP